MIQKRCGYSLLFYQSMYQKFAVAEEMNIIPAKKTVNSKIMGFYLFCFLPLHEVHTPDLIWVSKYYLL